MAQPHYLLYEGRVYPKAADKRFCVVYQQVSYVPQPWSSNKLAEEIDGLQIYQAKYVLEQCYERVVHVSPDSPCLICYGPIDHQQELEDFEMDVEWEDDFYNDVVFADEEETDE